jgi:hypothetical protein
MLAGLVSLAGLVRARACLRSAADAILQECLKKKKNLHSRKSFDPQQRGHWQPPSHKQKKIKKEGTRMPPLHTQKVLAHI